MGDVKLDEGSQALLRVPLRLGGLAVLKALDSWEVQYHVSLRDSVVIAPPLLRATLAQMEHHFTREAHATFEQLRQKVRWDHKEDTFWDNNQSMFSRSPITARDRILPTIPDTRRLATANREERAQQWHAPKRLSMRIHLKTLHSLLHDANRLTRARIVDSTSALTKHWKLVRPGRCGHTAFIGNEFVTNLKVAAGVPLLTAEQVRRGACPGCSRPILSPTERKQVGSGDLAGVKLADIIVHHGMTCRHNRAGWTRRHDAIRDLVWKLMREQGTMAEREVPIPRLHVGPGARRVVTVDIMYELKGDRGALDFVVSHPLRAGSLRFGSAAIRAARRKELHYRTALRGVRGAPRVAPFAISTGGAMTTGTFGFVKYHIIGNLLKMYPLADRAGIATRVYEALAVCLAKGNAALLSNMVLRWRH